MTKKKEPRYKLWAIYNQEGMAVGLAYTRTEGGAKKKWETETGGDRGDIYVETIELDNGFFPFTLLQ